MMFLSFNSSEQKLLSLSIEPDFIPGFSEVSICSITSSLCSVLSFVSFLLAIVVSVLL